MNSRWLLVLPLIATVLPLTSCAEVKNQLGLSRRTPDEFAVMTRAPLEMPPNMNALPMPQPGMQRPQEMSPVQSAQTAIFGQPAASANLESRAESGLLSRAGAADTNPNIRTIVNREAAEGAEDNRPVAKKLLGIVTSDEAKPASVLDAKGEFQRIKTNQQTGKPVTQGDTPQYDD